LDTKLKKGKIIRSFIYRMVAAGALLATIGLGILGREALINTYNEGIGTLSGNIYYLSEFREYMAYLYNQGMLGYAGIGDNNGYPLTDSGALERSEIAKEEFQNEIKYINNMLFYVEYNGKVIDSNISFPLFSEYDGHLLLPEDTSLCCYWDGSTNKLQFFSNTYASPNPQVLEDYYEAQYQPNMEKTGNIKLVLALKNTGSSGYLYTMTNQAWRNSNLLKAFVISAVILVLSWIGCLFTVKAGKQAKSTFLLAVSKVWLELRILIVIGMIYLCFYFDMWDFASTLNHRLTISSYWGLYFPMGMILYLLYIDFKRQEFAHWKQTLVYCICRQIGRYQKSLPWLKKALNIYYCVVISSVTLLLMGGYYAWFQRGFILRKWQIFYNPQKLLTPVILLTLAVLLLLASLRLKKLIDHTAALSNKLEDITAGRNTFPLKLPETSLLAEAAHNLNEVGNGVEAAIEQNNRSNKMRVELITNVSHDLKTPLTSIINYADLLCEEELPENAAAYAQSLRDKSYRLKSMVQDVFDLSKATSGNLKIDKTRLDLAKLIRQTLADMDERISESNLLFKLCISSEPLFIEADGEKLYRVFQNLIINALQYSLEHSRVHVVLEEKDGWAYARIKNISRQELNFTADEIMERFVRADTSRSTEGSGLGLSIVQSFTEACGGTFAIEMDADLFTACVSFPLLINTCIPSENGVYL